MTDVPVVARKKPLAKRGLLHAVYAATYSFAGLKRLWQESAFRQELAFAAATFGIFAVVGASLSSFGVQAVLFLMLTAVEALNTAIEVLVDRISPGFATFARDAKDLGSMAVSCVLLINAGFALFVVWQRIM